jgi:hypothetical protein
MPTIQQLPAASQASDQDEVPVSQAGVTRAVSVGELLAGTQPAIRMGSQTVLGRTSFGPGGPEPLQVGPGIAVQAGMIAANGSDHAGFPLQAQLDPTNEVLINAAGSPMRLGLSMLRGLFGSGTNISIDGNGIISAATDPSVTASLGALGQQATATQASVAALSAKIPVGGYVSLNAQGQITAPSAGDLSAGSVTAQGGVARTMSSRAADVVNVKDFGAVAGGADCTTAFNSAFAALATNGGEIFVPAGDYWLNAPLTWSGKALVLRGAGKGLTRLHLRHAGLGFDIAPANLFQKVVLRDFSAYAESASGQTAAVARITFPAIASFGYQTVLVQNIECFGYPNAVNSTAPYPQTFLRGLVLNGCWSTQIDNLSWSGPKGTSGTSASAVIELNGSIDTRIHGIQAYGSNAVVLQTGYCEGVYLSSPLVVAADYLMRQTDQTTWSGYKPNAPMLLGLWVANGECNTNLGTLQLANVSGARVIGMEFSRDGGPSSAVTLFDLTSCSNFHVLGCSFLGGPSGGGSLDTAFGLKSTWNSSGNVIGGCHFENVATVVAVSGVNGTVQMSTFGLNLENVPMATAFIDNTPPQMGNQIRFAAPATAGLPAGIGSTQDHVFSGGQGQVLFRVANVAAAVNFVRHQPGVTGSAASICFDGSDSTVSGVLQTKGGNLDVTNGGSGKILSLVNVAAATSWVQVQNGTAGVPSVVSTNAGDLKLAPKAALWLSPGTALFATGLPTQKPATGSGQIWNNGGVLSIA